MCRHADLDGPDPVLDPATLAGSVGRGQCARCGDPLPVDGACDCAGDEDRDTVTGWAGLKPRPCLVRVGRTNEMEEVWI